MYNAKPNRPGSKYNAKQAAAVIDSSHYLYQKFPTESPVQPGDVVSYNGQTGTVLEDGAYLIDNAHIHVRVKFADGPAAMAVDDLKRVFDYSALDTEARIVVQQKTSEIKTVMRRTTQDIIDIGTKLIEVKNRLGHGNFGSWLDVEFGWTDRTARKFMQVAEVFKTESGSDLNIGAKALYLLSAPSTPDEARQEAIQKAEAGEVITHTAAKAIVAQHKPAEPPRQPPPLPPVPAAPPVRVFAPVPSSPVRYSQAQDDYVEEFPAVQVDEVPEEDWQSEAADTIDEVLSELVEEKTPNPSPSPIATWEGRLAAAVATYAHHRSTSNEWYTPVEYVNAAREVMAGITLDPASCEYANKVVRAAMYYDIDTNGLLQPWEGNVFLNPPYGLDDNGDSNVATWVAKLISEFNGGKVKEAILLVNATPERKWFQPLWQYPVCFTDHRIQFYNANGQSNQPTQGNAFVYLGPHKLTFAAIFAEFGTVVSRMGV